MHPHVSPGPSRSMPIRFACPRCKQTLGVATRKAGTEVTCPKCGAPVTVPAAESQAVSPPEGRVVEAGLAESAHAPSRFTTPEIEETLNSLVIVDAAPNEAAPLQRKSAPLVSDGERKWLLIPRTVVYFQAALLAIVALLFFGAGWWIGTTSSVAPMSERSAEPSRLDVLLHYQPADGQAKPDEGAVVLVLPLETRVTGKIPAAALDPKEQTPASSVLEKLDHLGAAYGRTDAAGKRNGLVVPQSGPHYVLLLSNHARRSGEPRPQDLATLAAYLEDAHQLLTNRQYRLTREALSEEMKIQHDFISE